MLCIDCLCAILAIILCAFSCLPSDLRLLLPAIVPLFAYLYGHFFSCLPSRLFSFLTFLACLCVFSWLPLCLFLPALATSTYLHLPAFVLYILPLRCLLTSPLLVHAFSILLHLRLFLPAFVPFHSCLPHLLFYSFFAPCLDIVLCSSCFCSFSCLPLCFALDGCHCAFFLAIVVSIVACLCSLSSRLLMRLF